MSVVIPPGFGQISVRLTDDNSPHVSFITFGMNIGLAPDPEAMQTAVEAFMTDIIQDCAVTIHSAGFNVTVQDEEGAYGSFYIPFGEALQGAAEGEPYSSQVAFLYQKNTATPGRGHKGRFYLPGCTEDNVNGAGLVQADFLEDQRNHAASALAALTSSTDEDYVMLVLHSNSADVDPVLQLLPENSVATQRRRLVRTT